jgi:ParB family transcriptional regulator, chromosome partitioning protein
MATRKRPSVAPMRNVSAFLSPTTEPTELAELAELAATLPLIEVPIEQIILPNQQPRRYFDPAKMAHLIESVREHGILEPLIVRPIALNQYELIAGERRFRAAQSLNLTAVPISSREFTDREAQQIALVENLQREDLNPIEETEAILALLSLSLEVEPPEIVSILNQASNAQKRHLELTENVFRQYEQIEKVLQGIGRFTAQSFRSSRLPLLNLPEDILTVLRQGNLEYTKARAIAQVKDEAKRKNLLKLAVTKELSLSAIKEEITVLRAENGGGDRDPSDFKVRFDDIHRRVKQAKLWDDPKKRRRLEKMMSDLEVLLDSGVAQS